MSQMQKTAVQSPVITNVGRQSFGRAIAATLAVAAIIGLALFMAFRPTPVSPNVTPQTRALTDGFLPGAVAANQAARIAQAQRLTDGWQAGIVGAVGSDGNAIRDGWEAGLVGSAPAHQDAVGGWESHLPH